MIPGPTPIASHSPRVLHSVEPPDRPVEGMHVHHDADEVIRVIEGVVYLVLEDDERVLTPGDQATIPAGAPHRRWNAGDEDARVVEIHRAARTRSHRAARRAA